MFGYVRPFQGELRVKEYDAYKGVYCQLCRAMGQAYGRIARFSLSYDCTFYAMLALSLKETKMKAERKHCTCNPLKKCTYVCGAQDTYVDACFRKAAAFCVITMAYKLQDTVEDEKLLKRLGARFLRLISRNARKKAEAEYPFLATEVQKMVQAQHAAEQAEAVSVDACCAPTAEMLSAVCQELGSTESEKLVLQSVGYFLGRWVYLMDAADDLPEDLKQRHFNPFIQALQLEEYLGKALPADVRKAAELSCNEALNASVVQLQSAANLLPNGRFSGIMNNVIQLGLPETQREILFLHIKEKRNGRSV